MNFQSKLTTRSQKRKAVAELVSGDFEVFVAEHSASENLVASSSKVPRVEPESIVEIKTSPRKEIMSDLTKILAENQKEMLKLIAPLNKKQTVCTNVQDSDSEPENVSVTRTSTPVKVHTATSSETTPVNSRNRNLYKTCKTLHCRIAAKLRMHLIGSLIKLNEISEVLMHGRFFVNFTKSWKISLVTYKIM